MHTSERQPKRVREVIYKNALKVSEPLLCDMGGLTNLIQLDLANL